MHYKKSDCYPGDPELVFFKNRILHPGRVAISKLATLHDKHNMEKVVFHGLRRSYCTHLYNQGVPIAEIQ